MNAPDHSAALAHYQAQAALAARLVPPNAFTMRFPPEAPTVTTVKLYGATHTISIASCEGIPAYVDGVLLGLFCRHYATLPWWSIGSQKGNLCPQKGRRSPETAVCK
jgi:hypothetical protein